MPLMGGNPFWSERARDELRLQMSRPEDLPADGQGQPVPGDDEEVGRQLEEDSGLEAMENGSEGGSRGEPRQERRRGRARSRLGTPTMETTFTTPESWTNQGAVNRGPLRTAGMMPVDSGGGSRPGGGEPLRSQGVAFSADREGDDLQREVEKEMVQTLLEENEQLKHQMGQMKEWMKKIEEKSGYSDWSEVTVESPRAKRERAHGVEALRYTPNGTQVPAGPPPVGGDEDRPPVPPWPFPEWEIYEKDGKGHPRRMEIDSAEWQLQRGLYGGGASPRHKDCGRGTSSRQDVRQQEVGGSLGDPKVDRERWLMRELVQLQQALDSEKRSKVRWRVDEDGHLRQVPLGRAEHQGHLGQVPLSRADHPGHQEQVPLSRASHLGYQEGDRAKQWQQGEWGEKGQEGVGSGGAGRHQDLPELLGSDRSPLVLGDWLEVIAPIMKDVSPQAHRWWPLVEEEARHYYEKWRQSTPVERLYVKPQCKVVEEDPSLQRTEQRGISLLIKEVPETIRETIVSERLMTSTGIIFTLMKNFQPGGANERTMLLKTLTQPSWGASIKEATTTMRTWRRFHKRTSEIGAALPDATVLMKALEDPMQLVSRSDAQATFRLSQARAMLEVDSKPTMTAVWSFSECLLAELESLLLASGTDTVVKDTSSGTTPTVKQMQGPPSTPACKFWGSEGGCRLGKKCGYTHDWQSLPDRASRCFVCSALSHRKQDCPARTVGDKAPTGGSGVTKGKGNGKSKSKKGEESSSTSSSTTTKGKGNGNGNGGVGSSTQSSSTQSGLQEASLKAMQGTGVPSSAESVAGSTASKPESLSTEKELMGEVASLLKSLRVGEGNPNPQLSAVRLARILNQDKAVLIDGGATHCLRNPHSREEYLNHAEEVRVDLAAGSVRMRQDTGTGTLYSEDPNLQPIVPLADVIKVGVVVK